MTRVELPPEWSSWTILDEIGRGSYGAVYRAEKVTGDIRAVSAIKVIEISAAQYQMDGPATPEAQRSYLKDLADGCANEIRAMYRLQGDPNIVSIQDHAIREEDGGLRWTLFIRMELLTNFEDYAVTRQFSQGDILQIGTSLCSALMKCEKYRIIHRDIKPANIFVTEDGAYKLGDFGIARTLEQASAKYSSRGTFPYMAPEVFKGESYGQSVDIYSLGLLLYRRLNRNRDPFVNLDKQIVYGRDQEEALMRRIGGEPLPPPADADDALARIVLKACAYDPEARYATAAEMKADLDRLAPRYARTEGRRAAARAARPTKATAAHPAAGARPAAQAPRRRPPRWALIAAAAVVIAAIALALPARAPAPPEGQLYAVENIAFYVPEYFTPAEDGEGMFTYAPERATVANLSLSGGDRDLSGEAEPWYQSTVQRYVTQFQERYASVEGPENARELTIGGLPGCAFDLRYQLSDGTPAHSRIAFCYDAGRRRMAYVSLYAFREAEPDLFADFDALLDGARAQ